MFCKIQWQTFRTSFSFHPTQKTCGKINVHSTKISSQVPRDVEEIGKTWGKARTINQERESFEAKMRNNIAPTNVLGT